MSNEVSTPVATNFEYKTVCVITAADYRWGQSGRFAGVIGVAQTSIEAMTLADSATRKLVMDQFNEDFGAPLSPDLIEIKWRRLSAIDPGNHWVSEAYINGVVAAESPVMHVQELPVGVVAQDLQKRGSLWESI